MRQHRAMDTDTHIGQTGVCTSRELCSWFRLSATQHDTAPRSRSQLIHTYTHTHIGTACILLVYIHTHTYIKSCTYLYTYVVLSIYYTQFIDSSYTCIHIYMHNSSAYTCSSYTRIHKIIRNNIHTHTYTL